MSSAGEIFSLRLVIADFYMEKPIAGLDTCYSEFRSKEIRKVPIIRIFGTNASGHKTCMHVHGVFPYFYVPYDPSEFASLNQAIYQIALNIDKAINISLSQGASSAQHVFKVQLVKGIPFYGYHRSNHQFLKIFMFNPRFVRRAANLLQNGVILNKNFHPHESHVPYVLQFMIDYNLYGMSFVHVPLEIVKFRRSGNVEETYNKNIPKTQLLDINLAKKVSCSSLEVDICSNFILNRFQLIANTSASHANPGIESIWNDERLRRQKLAQIADNENNFNEIPTLELPNTQQERPNVQPTESEHFFRAGLISKLLGMEQSLNESTQISNQTLNSSPSINSSLSKEQKRIFNLTKLLQNYIYPEECKQDDNVINASYIPNHLSNNNIFEQTLLISSSEKKQEEDENITFDDCSIMNNTVVDKELVLNLTQNQSQKIEHHQKYMPLNATLREEDMQLLDILQQLEENNEHKIDLDSSLAPLSQTHKNFALSPEELDKETTAAALQQPAGDSDSEEDIHGDMNLHDFSIALEDLDDLILKLTQSQKVSSPSQEKCQSHIPQVDGADELLKTPTKSARKVTTRTSPRTPTTPKNRCLNMSSPRRSPRTPKTNHKYAQLPLVSVKRLPSNTTSPLQRNATNRKSLPMASLRKTLALTDLRRKSISLDTNVEEHLTLLKESSRQRRAKKLINLDKTHITCALRSRRTSEKLLKICSVKDPEMKMTRSSRDLPNEIIQEKYNNEEKQKNLLAPENLKSEVITHSDTTNADTNGLPKTLDNNNKTKQLKHLSSKSVLTSANDIRESPIFLKTPETSTKKRGLEEFVCDKYDLSKTDKNLLLSPGNTSLSIETFAQKVDKKQNFKLKKCKVKLKRIKPTLAVLPKTSSNVIEVEQHRCEKYETNYTQQNLCQNLENLQEALKLHMQATDNFHISTCTKNLTNAASFCVLTASDSSDEEIVETPPQLSKQSFKLTHVYNKSWHLKSPLVFTQNSSPELLANAESCGTLSLSSNDSLIKPEMNLILTPLHLPPSRDEVLKGCRKFQLPEYEFQQPFYSNPDDITKHKELGFTILQIPGNKLNDVEEFQSILGRDVKGLTAWRREQLLRLGGVEMLNKYCSAQHIREYFSNMKPVVITPQFNVPSRQDVKLWLKAREVLKNKGEDLEELKSKNVEEDSPIKIRRQKVNLILSVEGDNDSDENLDCTSRSLTLTPLRSQTPVRKDRVTPAAKHLERISLKRDVSLRKRNNCRLLKRVSISKQFNNLIQDEMSLNESQSQMALPQTQLEAAINVSQIVPNSQRSETSVTSETALAHLENVSFLRHIKEADVTIGGSSENSTLNNTFGFKVALENLQQAKADVESNYLTIVTLELFVATREDLYPNPELDEIRCLFYAIENSIPNDHIHLDQKLPNKACGYIIVHDHRDTVSKEGPIHGIDIDIERTVVQTEVEALEALLGLCSRWDPDIYAGYEIEMSSWGYVIERAKFLCLNIAPLLSRVPTQKVSDFVDEERESFTDLDVEMKLCGRILLDVWRLLRSEIALTSYTFENVMYHIMHKRCPWHSYRDLSAWFASPCSRWIVIEYYLERVRGTLSLLDQLDLIGRTCEMAKLMGIQFYEVLSRGSQFRVESMMLRIAKPKNLVPLSPSVQQRAHMRAPEYLPLIMEPQSRFYADPLIVLDFQSLYPSMIIAYNYCFSTCLGRVEHLGQSNPFEFGASQLRISPAMLRKLVDDDLITISPCGVVFVKSSVREGILPRMLTEILDTRQMVKQSMKLHKSNSALQRILHSRQLGLKLMANVTYGYTAANFSGRMPAVEVGDSVVAKGRETLERAIKLVEANDKWNVKVVYGDTDSMFVLVPGRHRDEAFRIGEEIAEAVTKHNPHPVKLKLEKVYQPCILQTKKRYVGYMYETAEQAEPVYEAKGIETVRRDGCPIVAKMLEKVLRILFESADVSQVKRYVCRQFTKLLCGRANLQDLIFAKEFRGINGYRPTACVPALELTRKWIRTDPRRVPRRGERVPFIVTNGPPGVPLIRLVRHPHEVLVDEGLKVNAVYYITKAIIPPLNRCLLLIGADVNEWFANLPRKILLTSTVATANEAISCNNSKNVKKSTISQFFSTTNCVADCGRQTKHGICSECSVNPTRSSIILQSKISKIERSYLTTQNICQACCGRVGDLKCGSLDCPVLYVLEVKRRDLQQIMHFRKFVEKLF